MNIEQRPEEVEQKLRVGDWKVGTVSGSKEKSSYLVTLVERKTRLTLAAKVESRNSDVVAAAVVKMLTPYKDTMHSITSDNGKEFARHELISERLEADFYFARPYRFVVLKSGTSGADRYHAVMKTLASMRYFTGNPSGPARWRVF